MRISRPCYDKYYRCPGWAGGGTRYAKKDRCDGGHLDYKIMDKAIWKWRFNRCDRCDVVTLPYVVRYVDWRFLVFWQIRNLKWWYKDRKAKKRWTS